MSGKRSSQRKPKQWVRFSEREQAVGRKTKVWDVKTLDGLYLGTVSWFSRWRQYNFFPGVDTTYNADCMRQITGFMEAETYLHRVTAKAAKIDAATV